MNYGRLALAAVAAFVVDMLYGYVVYGNLLTPQFAAFPGVFRAPAAQMAYMPSLAGGILVGMIAAVCIYAKGYEGGSSVAEGARFGLLMAVFNIGYVVATNYATLNAGGSLAVCMAVAALVEWLLVGIVIGLTYKPARVLAGAR